MRNLCCKISLERRGPWPLPNGNEQLVVIKDVQFSGRFKAGKTSESLSGCHLFPEAGCRFQRM